MEHTQRAYADYLRGQDSTEEWDRDVQDIFGKETELSPLIM